MSILGNPAWLQYIGDRKVRTLADARAYLRKGALDMYGYETADAGS